MSETTAEFIEDLYQLEPSLKTEGLKNFGGYFVHWDEIVKVCLQGYPEGTKLMWDCSPAELITNLINERDDAEAKIGQLKKQYNKDVMHLCKSKPPECFSGYGACLSCKLRETCRLLYAKAEGE